MFVNKVVFNLLSILVVIAPLVTVTQFQGSYLDPFEKKYASFPESQRLELLDATRQMFYFAYDNYMKHAFPKDELDPIHCTGRGPDYDNPYVSNVM